MKNHYISEKGQSKIDELLKLVDVLPAVWLLAGRGPKHLNSLNSISQRIQIGS